MKARILFTALFISGLLLVSRGGYASDSDGDTWEDEYDNCVTMANPEQADNDVDEIGDVCDPDDDNDGVIDTLDLYPTDSSRFM